MGSNKLVVELDVLNEHSKLLVDLFLRYLNTDILEVREAKLSCLVVDQADTDAF